MLTPRIVAHGIGGVQDLPVPTWLFFWGGAVVLVVSFVALGALWQTPRLAAAAAGRRAPGATFGRVVLGPVRIAVQALSVVLFVARARLGARRHAAIRSATSRRPGSTSSSGSGLPLLSLLFGNVWRALSPWRALADAFVWVWERLGREARPLAVYPERLGRYPGRVALLRVRRARALLLEPVEPARARVRDRALLLRGAVRDGRVRPRRPGPSAGRGSRSCSPTSARMAPLTLRDGRIRAARCRSPASPAPSRCRARSLFLAVALGSVGFDGFGRTTPGRT